MIAYEPETPDELLEDYERLMDQMNDFADEFTKATEEGVYYTPKGEIYRLRLKNGWLKTYRFDPQTRKFKSVWDGAKLVRSTERLSREQLIELSITLGICAYCGRMLTAAQSAARGIGPICFKAYK